MTLLSSVYCVISFPAMRNKSAKIVSVNTNQWILCRFGRSPIGSAVYTTLVHCALMLWRYRRTQIQQMTMFCALLDISGICWLIMSLTWQDQSKSIKRIWWSTKGRNRQNKPGRLLYLIFRLICMHEILNWSP